VAIHHRIPASYFLARSARTRYLAILLRKFIFQSPIRLARVNSHGAARGTAFFLHKFQFSYFTFKFHTIYRMKSPSYYLFRSSRRWQYSHCLSSHLLFQNERLIISSATPVIIFFRSSTSPLWSSNFSLRYAPRAVGSIKSI
jgi:hypothetical protein